MADSDTIARSPITPAGSVRVFKGWEVSLRRSASELRLADWSPLAKVLVRAPADGAVARALEVPLGRAARNPDGVLVTGSGPEEWTLYGAPGTASRLVANVEVLVPADEFVSVLDATHGRALVRATGDRSADLLSKLCAIDLRDAVTPNGAAFRTSVAQVGTDVVRDDWGGVRSYLLASERSLGAYLFAALLDAGSEFGIDIEGFLPSEM